MVGSADAGLGNGDAEDGFTFPRGIAGNEPLPLEGTVTVPRGGGPTGGAAGRFLASIFAGVLDP